MSIIKRRPKILLYGNVVGSYRSQNLVKFLLDSGYRISLLSPDFYTEHGEKKSLFAKLARMILSGYRFVELFIQTALADIVYVLPLNTQLIKPVGLACRLCGAKLITEMYISRYDTLVRERQEIEANSVLANKAKASDITALTQSDYVVHLSRYELQYWGDLLNIKIDFDKVLIAPLFCEPDLINFQSSHVFDGVLNIFWWGTFIPTHGLDVILQALIILKQKQIKYTCHLFGIPPKGKEHLFKDYETQIETADLGDRVFLRKDLRFSDNSLPRYLAENCDVALGIFGRTEKAKAAIPNKLVEALTMGIPILTMDTPALEEFFDPDTDLWTCGSDPDAIAEALSAIANQTAPQVNWEKTQQKVLDLFNLTQYQKVIEKGITAAVADLNARNFTG